MPCFSPLVGEWAPKDSPEYQAALADLEKAKHVVDSYLEMYGIARPDGSRIELPDAKFSNGAVKDFCLQRVNGPLLHRMAQHFLCDGVDFYHLTPAQV